MLGLYNYIRSFTYLKLQYAKSRSYRKWNGWLQIL